MPNPAPLEVSRKMSSSDKKPDITGRSEKSGKPDNYDKTRVPFIYKAGETVGDDYILEELLGRGGSGVVFKARHKIMNKHFAIKILTAELADEKSWQRFQREVQTLVKLNHPNIVRVFNMGIDREQYPFCAMELLNGPTLAQVIKNEQFLFAGDAIEYFLAVSKALETAHKAKIIHRDIKPGNIVLTHEGEGENSTVKVKLVDFGLARLADDNINLLKAAERSKQSLTEKGEVFGSPLYMSPEQCRGQDLDHRTDIYSLGCSFFEALTGQVPFHGKTVVNTFQMHESAPVPSLSKCNPEGVFPEELEHTIKRMLEKDPDKRYQNMASVIHDLERIRVGKPVKSTLSEVRDSAFAENDYTGSQTSGQRTSLTQWLVGKKGLAVISFFLLFSLGAAAATCYLIINPPKQESREKQERRKQNQQDEKAQSPAPVQKVVKKISRADYAPFKRVEYKEKDGKYLTLQFPPCFEGCAITDANHKYFDQLQNQMLNPFYVKAPITFQLNALNVPARCLSTFAPLDVDNADVNFMNTYQDWVEFGQALKQWGHIGFIRISASAIPKIESSDPSQSCLNQIPAKPTMSVSITHCKIPHWEMENFRLPTYVLFYCFADNTQDIRDGKGLKKFDAETIMKPVMVQKNIRSIRLCNLSWTERDFANILQLNDLEVLELRGMTLTPQKILALKKLKRLRELTLCQDDCSPFVLKEIANLKQLQTFCFVCNEKDAASKKTMQQYYKDQHVTFQTVFVPIEGTDPMRDMMKGEKELKFLGDKI